jgi:hypothetical protein
MAAFLSRTVDGVVRRGSRRAAADKFWTPQNENMLGMTTVGGFLKGIRYDGADIWTSNGSGDTVSRVRASDGLLLQTWTGADEAWGVVVARGSIIVAGATSPGKLYAIDPRLAPGAVTTVASNLGAAPSSIVFDGGRVWTANQGAPGSVSIVTPGAIIPWSVTTVAAGFTTLRGSVFDGAAVWVTDVGTGTLLKLDSAGAILQTVTVGLGPSYPAFDGTNLWVPNFTSSSVTVVRAASGAVLQTLTDAALVNPLTAAFDGERVLVTSQSAGKVVLWKAADLTLLGSFSTGTGTLPFGACSDGLNFWIGVGGGRLARF